MSDDELPYVDFRSLASPSVVCTSVLVLGYEVLTAWRAVVSARGQAAAVTGSDDGDVWTLASPEAFSPDGSARSRPPNHRSRRRRNAGCRWNQRSGHGVGWRDVG